MDLCDRLRDEDLVDLGVAVDDQPGQSYDHDYFDEQIAHFLFADGQALIKLVPRETLIKAREEKQQAAQLKAAKAEEKRRLAEKQAQMKAETAAKELEAGRHSPREHFVSQTDKYKSFDEDGLPTHDVAGELLTKSALKRLKKEWDVQAKRHDKYLKSKTSGTS